MVDEDFAVEVGDDDLVVVGGDQDLVKAVSATDFGR